MSPLTLFLNIMRDLQKEHAHLSAGEVLSSPAIEYKGRAFAFCARGKIVVKLRNQECLEREGIRAAKRYTPFINNVASRLWTQIPFYYAHDWPALAAEALTFAREEAEWQG